MQKTAEFINAQIQKKRSFLCVGLDPDVQKMDASFLQSKTPLFDFCKEIIDCTHDLSVAYKLNVAFFEALGPGGWEQLEMLIPHIPNDCLVIADAKRGDIGNTSGKYAQYYFDRLKVDAITLHPYMGVDSLAPFLERNDKWSIILALTSNEGSKDFEFLPLKNENTFLFEKILKTFSHSVYNQNIMFVVGATHPEYFTIVRSICPNHFLLVPGIGEQGGDLEKTIQLGAVNGGNLLINVGRKILFPTYAGDLQNAVRASAISFRDQMM